jgi:hypothetical protein
LIDFGLARKLNAEKDLKILFGTPEFVGNWFIYKKLSSVSQGLNVEWIIA